MDNAIALAKPGATTADIVPVWPTAQEFGLPDEEAAFALQYGHGVGPEASGRPIFSRLPRWRHPETLEPGQVFALETYWPADDGWGAARIEEEVIVTDTGCEVITKFPAEELLVAGQALLHRWRLPQHRRDSQSHINTQRVSMNVPDASSRLTTGTAGQGPRCHSRRMTSPPSAGG